MRKLLFILIIPFLFASCNDDEKEQTPVINPTGKTYIVKRDYENNYKDVLEIKFIDNKLFTTNNYIVNPVDGKIIRQNNYYCGNYKLNNKELKLYFDSIRTGDGKFIALHDEMVSSNPEIHKFISNDVFVFYRYTKDGIVGYDTLYAIK